MRAFKVSKIVSGAKQFNLEIDNFTATRIHISCSYIFITYTLINPCEISTEFGTSGKQYTDFNKTCELLSNLKKFDVWLKENYDDLTVDL